jgi:hypothetical protein
LASNVLAGQIQINELMSDNQEFIADKFGNFPDWIELYNYGNDTVDLSLWYLSDEKDKRFKFQLPDTLLPPGTYILIWASGDEDYYDDFHANFRIRKEGETIYLTDKDLLIGDTAFVPYTESNHSFGRVENGHLWKDFRLASPLSYNSKDNLKYPVQLVVSPDLNNLNKKDKLAIEHQGNCSSTNFTLDGRDPVLFGSMTENDMIAIDFNDKPNAFYTLFPTVEGYRLPIKNHRLPYLTIACSDSSGQTVGKLTKILINHEQLEVHSSTPIIFLEVDQTSLFDDNRGIMINGESGNFLQEGRAWERAAGMTIFQSGEEPKERQVGIRIHGHATRELPQKSLKLYSRPEYDSLAIPDLLSDGVFHLPYDRLLLRSFHSDHIGNEYKDFGFRDDVVMHIIGQEMNIITQRSRPVTLFINGEYWGLYSLHEASDDDQIARETGLHKDSIELMSGPAQLNHFHSIIKHLDLDKPTDRLAFGQYFDIDNLVDYLLAEVFFLNRDWPHNNIKTWKEKGSDGPYHFILFDMDASLKHASNNYFNRFFAEFTHPNQFEASFDPFFQWLLSSRYFNHLLKERYLELRQSILAPESMILKLKEWKETIEDQIDYQTARWHYPKSKEAWNANYKEIETFLKNRDMYFLEHISQLNGNVLFPNPLLGTLICLKDGDRSLYRSAKIFDISGKLIHSGQITDGCLTIPSFGVSPNLIFVHLISENLTRTEAVLLLR